MTLSPGTKLGPYEIVTLLGAGGMGEVYRARDTRLDRTVAIKILSKGFSDDPVRKQRFEREAKIISGMNHPNICTVHDVGSQDGMDYLVMEFLEGESLAQRLEKGPLPTDQILKVGGEIANALDKAHRSGIIHRDLKPGNIMLTKVNAKLLDFGLARPTWQSASQATLTTAAWRQSPVTQEGTVVGTFQYMSPEQVEGKELDARSDIFSLGAVLYEMVTGRKAFEGKSQFSMVSAILEKEPVPISTIKPMSPRGLDHIIRRCLDKDPDERWQTARDLALELRSINLAEPLASGSSIATVRHGGGLRAWLGWCVAALLTVSVILLLTRPKLRTPLPQGTIRASILAPEGKEFDQRAAAVISPDGKYLAFSAAAPGWGGQLYLRRIDSLSETPLSGTEGALNPFWSPDSRWIGFVAGSKLRKISVDGGSPITICNSSDLRGGSWGSNGTILFVPSVGVPVYSVSEAGGTPIAVTQLDQSAGELTHRWPVFLPDGKHFLFFSRGRENAIYAASVDSKERKLILKNDTNALYVSPGYLLFVRDGVLMAQSFDVEHLKLRGSAVAVADGVPIFGGQQRGLFSASEQGTLAIHSKAEMLTQLVWVDPLGRPLEPLADPAMFALRTSFMRVSPDGSKLVLGIIDPKDGSENLWVIDMASHQMTRLTFEKLLAQFPLWSPDGSRLLYSSNRIGHPQMFSIAAAGVSEGQLFLPSDYNDGAESWSPDGRYLIFRRAPIEAIGETGLWVLPLFGDKKAYPLFADSHSQQQWGAVFSPDGKWLAYESNESGAWELYIVPFPNARMKIQISKNGAILPHWSRDGRQLFYLGKDHVITVASLRFAAGGVEVTDTRNLFKLEIPDFEVSADGKRFLVYKAVDNQEPSSLTLITNWTNALPK
jgi:eukaryotic-like serine/threonine-protein kinase